MSFNRVFVALSLIGISILSSCSPKTDQVAIVTPAPDETGPTGWQLIQGNGVSLWLPPDWNLVSLHDFKREFLAVSNSAEPEVSVVQISAPVMDNLILFAQDKDLDGWSEGSALMIFKFGAMTNSLTDFYEEFIPTNSGQNRLLEKETIILEDNRVAIRVLALIYTSGGPFYYLYYYILDDDTIYAIIFGSTLDAYEQISHIYDEIMSTFRILDQQLE